MNSNLGIFNSYRDSMGQIKDDFKQAIEREIKSEKMKSELITSVSHDLSPFNFHCHICRFIKKSKY